MTGPTTSPTTGPTTSRYLAPDRLTRRLMNPVVAGLVKLGVSPWGARVLEVRGRTSGEWRSNPVNLLTVDGETYLVAPRGHTQWVRNLRAAGEGRLRRGRRRRPITAVELADDAKAPILRAYVERWGWEVGQFFEGLDADATDEQLRHVAPGFPVFRITPA
jgi:deazaflavin-dependent oxidoreductase (nitroreductase family)